MPALDPGQNRAAKAQRRELPKPAGKKRPEQERTGGRPAVRRPGPRGWLGRSRGEASVIQPADEWRGTTVQVCGLHPFSVGTGTPMIGVPLGLQLFTGATVCADPISWFQDAGLISNPSVFVLGLPGLGKSTLIRRMAAGGAGMGNLPLILGDLKPDYVDMIRALGGQVITLGRGRGHLNILDPGEATAAAERLRLAGKEKERQHVLADAHGRRHTMVAALLTILRKEPPTDREESIIDRALTVLDERSEGVPVLGDLLRIIQEAPDEVRAVALDRGDDTRYKQITENLEASLISLTSGGRLGETFAHPTDVPMMRDRPVVYDVSSIDDSDTDMQAAILLACWSAGFGMVNINNALADAGLEPRRHYLVVLDELWRALRAGRGMVDRVDALTRLNRQRGVGLAMISHTMSDLLALPTESERMKARGFVERSGMVIAGGLPAAEMPMLTSAVPLSRAEQDLLTSWQDPGAWDTGAGHEAEPPGRGKFLIKVGGHPGIPVKVELIESERPINDTNKLWHQADASPDSDTVTPLNGLDDVDVEGAA
ncbi:ATP/GTP-binding protein [Cryobacterium psychrophilum]|uniref:ATP/GTP-binding protein n=1 Tax=Cryobacterium psychrophilum TaxID=41988 RepID=A0A4Y8KIE6_9MICO|nr:ATP/GTP-binding protein [Cryobacterium psychrophilum]TDW26985.1 hypothetical protein EDD25_3555 [Cryobacterium psychrophilum]TFD75296.1 ATP/GTP-binding protein [Cryobacterium psychrophilum]